MTGLQHAVSQQLGESAPAEEGQASFLLVAAIAAAVAVVAAVEECGWKKKETQAAAKYQVAADQYEGADRQTKRQRADMTGGACNAAAAADVGQAVGVKMKRTGRSAARHGKRRESASLYPHEQGRFESGEKAEGS